MISAGFKRISKSREDRFAVMMNFRRLAMKDFGGPDNVPAKDLSNRLMSETNAENRNATAKSFDHLHRDTGLIGRARAGRNNDLIRTKRRCNFFDGDFTVAPHFNLLAQ